MHGLGLSLSPVHFPAFAEVFQALSRLPADLPGGNSDFDAALRRGSAVPVRGVGPGQLNRAFLDGVGLSAHFT